MTFPTIRWIYPHGNRPSFSPTGDQLVFQVDSGNDWSWSQTIAFSNGGTIWTINSDGSGAAPYSSGTVPLSEPVNMTYPS